MDFRIIITAVMCLAVAGCTQTEKGSQSPASAVKNALIKGCAFNATFESAFELAEIFEIVVPYGEKIRKAATLVCSKVKAGSKSGTVEITVKGKNGKLRTIVLERE